MEAMYSDKDLMDLMAQEEAAKREREAYLRERLDTELASAPTQIDWTPLAAQLDQMAGGGDLAQKAAASNYAVTNGIGDEADWLQRQLGTSAAGGKSTARDMAQMRAREAIKRAGVKESQGIAQEFNRAQDDRSKILKIEDDLSKWREKEVDEKLDEKYGQYDTLTKALSMGDFAQFSSVLSSFARGVSGEKGSLSDGDVARVFRNPKVNSLETLKTWLTGEGKLDPSTQQKLGDLIEIGKAAISQTLDNKIATKKKELTKSKVASSLGVSGDTLDVYDQDERYNLFKNYNKDAVDRYKKAEKDYAEGRAKETAASQSVDPLDEMLRVLTPQPKVK